MEAPALTREFRKNALDEIARSHQTGTDGIRTALRLTHLHDSLLSAAWKRVASAADVPVTVVALGGYGRAELCFGSDLDIMLLVPADGVKETLAEPIGAFLHDLLDCGLDLGHSVRSISDCLALRDHDPESWLSLLESRIVAGSKELFTAYQRAIGKAVKESSPAEWVDRLRALAERRHAKYGNSAKLLEPNIKNSAGGLRDLHTTLWLLRATGSMPLHPRTGRLTPAITLLLQASPVRKLLTQIQAKEVRSAFSVLLRVRCAMHLHAHGLHDSLNFSQQPPIAAGLRYRERTHRSKVEHFMSDYYRAARTAARLCDRVCTWGAHRWPATAPSIPVERKKSPIPPKRLTSSALLRLIHDHAANGGEFSFEMEDRIHRQREQFGPLRSKEECETWNSLFQSPAGIARTLQMTNDLGLLDRWIPEWKPMVAFFQHNQYHYYTADEHTMLALANAEKLETSPTLFGETYRSLPRREVLRWACLFHDIAKPIRVTQHETLGVPIVRRVMKRLGAGIHADDVAFLVRHHLLMEQVAFRRNLNDPQTIADFARHFRKPELLDYLLVLTYADLSAVNTNVLTEWKSTLLSDLYRRTREALTRSMSAEEIHTRSLQRRDEVARTLVQELSDEFPAATIRGHVEQMEDPTYFLAFTGSEIREHVRAISNLTDLEVLFRHTDTVTDVTIIAKDAPFALSRFCGILSANDANILVAGIFTRRDGTIIDRFRVTDFVSHARLSDRQCEQIRSDFDGVFRKQMDIAVLLGRHRAKWKRRSIAPNTNIRLDVEFEEHPRFTIIDVYAADTLGFLHRITDSISRLGLNITFAKIATRGDGIVDSFYVTDHSGGRITDAGRMEEIRHELLATIRETAEHELVLE